MRKKILGAIVAMSFVMPLSVGALTLSPQANQQLTSLALQLVQILSQLSAAQAQGPAYTSSAAFQPVAAAISAQIIQIQSQLVPILMGSAQSGGTVRPTIACPAFSRDLEFGFEGVDVLQLQQFLGRDASAAFRGQTGGNFDLDTLAAVQRFQAAHGIGSGAGFGRVGPLTRAAIVNACNAMPPVQVAPPVQTIIPVTTVIPTTVVQTPLTPPTASFIASYGGSEANAVSFAITMQPSSPCTAAQFTLVFGDGGQQTVAFNSSCSQQTQTIRHVYSNAGTYSVQLNSGSFQIGQSLKVPLSSTGGATMSLGAAKGATSYSAIIYATSTAGSSCAASTYTLAFGDGTSQTLDYSATCGARLKTINHTYTDAGTYTITASDSQGTATTLSFQATVVAAAGAGDPFIAALLHADGADGSTSVIDNGLNAHTWTAFGNASIDATSHAEGTGAFILDGSGDYISTPASNDFNFGTGAFTIDLWFAVHAFPAAGTQAALIQQSDAAGHDATFGGAGLELFGDQLHVTGTIGSSTYHPYYNNSLHTGSLVTQHWYHAAVVRSGNTVTLYLDGVKQGATTVSGAANASSNAMTIGRFGERDGSYFEGWIDEVRISKGIARWTSDFTVAGATPPPEPQNQSDQYTVLLLHGDPGASATQTLDSSVYTHPVSLNNGATTALEPSLFVGSALYFDGINDNLTVPSSQDWDFGAGDFTIDMWVFPQQVNGLRGVISRADGSSWSPFHIFINEGNYYFDASSGGGWNVCYNTPMGSAQANTWTHLSVERKGSTFTTYNNGVPTGTCTSSLGLWNSGAPLQIGQQAPNLRFFNGYIMEVRVSKGVARWQGQFTPPIVIF